MKRFSTAIAGLFLFTSFTANSNNAALSDLTKKATESVSAVSTFELSLSNVYSGAHLEQSGLDYQVFRKAIIGYYNLKRTAPHTIKKPVLSIIDFNKASTQNRLWIIDLKSKKLLYNTLVAHGKNSGSNYAREFSNKPNSEMSSLGFYATGQTYQGKHGLSLRISGLDKGFNTNAEKRAVVIHGASYVSQEFVRQHGRLGRSQGCPALPEKLTPEIINTIKNNSCLYINGPEQVYTSAYLSLEPTLAQYALTQELTSGNI